MKMSKCENDQIVSYILRWLCYGDEEAAQRIAYTADESALETHDVIIVPGGLLGKEIVYPELKKPIVEQPIKGKTIIRTDIVYTTFFFASRAEELINPQRDEHDRFAAKFSILGQKSRMQIPRLDEYARLVLKQLNMPMPEPGFGHIYLTHDIDAIEQYRHNNCREYPYKHCCGGAVSLPVCNLFPKADIAGSRIPFRVCA